MDHTPIEAELRDMLTRVLEVAELNQDELEFNTEMTVKYARVLLAETA